jgi:hypothetical protein
MGFPRKRIYNLEFKSGDPVTDGLEVRATAPTLIDSLEAKQKQGPDETDRQFLDRQYGAMIGHILSWNIEDEDGQPLPVTLEDWYTIDLPVQLRIYRAWSGIGENIEATSPLDKSSGPASTTGSTMGPDPAIEASIPSQALP